MKQVTVNLSADRSWEVWKGNVPDDFSIQDIEKHWMEYCFLVDSGATNYIIDNIEVEE